MKERFIKLGSKTKMIAGAIALATLMAVSVQIGMNNGSTTDITLFGLEVSVFTQAVVAKIDLYFFGVFGRMASLLIDF